MGVKKTGVAYCRWCAIESQTEDVCSWCKRPIEAGPTAPASTRPELHFLRDSDADGHSAPIRELAIGIIVSASVMGLALFLVLRPTPQTSKPLTKVETTLTAERPAPAETVSYQRPAPLSPPSGVTDEYEPERPPPGRADGREPTLQATRVNADSYGQTPRARVQGPKAYVESVDINISRVDRDATVTAKVFLVNNDTKPVVRFRLQLEINGLRTVLEETAASKAQGKVAGSSSVEVMLEAKTLMDERDLLSRKRILLDAWYANSSQSVKDSLLIQTPKPKASPAGSQAGR